MPYRRTKLVHGVGINDADYSVREKRGDGSRRICPIYGTWSRMLKRCYSEKYQAGQKTYIGCTVCEGWLTFSTFRKWMLTQNWKGKHLDKDVVTPGNRIYGPNTCCFIPQGLNNILCDAGAIRGEHPKGVSWNKAIQKFSSSITIDGKGKHLGYYDTSEDASRQYKIAKYNYLLSKSREQIDDRIKLGLYTHAYNVLCFT